MKAFTSEINEMENEGSDGFAHKCMFFSQKMKQCFTETVVALRS